MQHIHFVSEYFDSNKLCQTEQFYPRLRLKMASSKRDYQCNKPSKTSEFSAIKSLRAAQQH